ncbi:hypothetical protein BJ138DRAFT_601386 [Hygrophoropsis aurantiaca]|uniref:Uncharacterized protein n=1 Tax=Hygrophoropsis aurantiaca TaxID=72124 RepID=A0ACB8AV89_9AGAM|nr:hypothetical protein BJ138DRAFT_601386 [Hygrophoropsis aurantiaca]
MPRLLPRLLEHLRDASKLEKKSKFKVPPFAVQDRTKSIVLDEPLISDRRIYDRHKGLPPRRDDKRRTRMVVEPLPMLSSPLRTCVMTQRYLPSDFLIRLAPFQLPVLRSARPAQSILPDGFEHPKFACRKARTAFYITCWKDVIRDLKYRVPLQRFAPNTSVHSLLGDQIEYLLRLRVLQELEILIERLSASACHNPDATVIRRLTRAEWKTFLTTGTLSDRDAVALLVVPPLNRDPVTKKRPQPSSAPDFQALGRGFQQNDANNNAAPPLSTLHPNDASITHDHPLPFDQFSTSKTPLYNGLALFPSQSHRATFHAALCKLLFIERKTCRKRHNNLTSPKARVDGSRQTSDHEKGSHTLLLRSNKNTIERADTAALPIALWRLRMWRGDAYQLPRSGEDGWEVEGQWRTEYASRMR